MERGNNSLGSRNNQLIYSRPCYTILFLVLAACLLTLPACTPEVPALAPVTSTTQPNFTQTPTRALLTLTPEVLPTQAVSASPHKPALNPLTGLPPDDPDLLDRRPLLIKIENLPRNNRPQYGLNQADVVYEYHTEEGTTRFAAVFYGKQSEKIGPVRSARWFDIELVKMYKAIFIYGSAYQKLYDHLFDQDFADRLILEGPNTYPALYRYEPAGKNLLLVNTPLLTQVIEDYKINNTRQALGGMSFSEEVLMDGTTADSVFVRFSGAIYNRWDYDSEQKVYYRNVDAQDDINGTNEVYVPHIDALNGTQVFTDNIVILISEYKEMDGPTITSPELIGTGTAYVARNGILIECQWIREYPNDMVKLIGDDKQPIQLKPGRTWYEVLNIGSKVSTDDKGTWRVVNYMPE